MFKCLAILYLLSIGLLFILPGVADNETLELGNSSISVLDSKGHSHGGGLDPSGGIGQSVYRDDNKVDVYFAIKTIKMPHNVTIKWINETGFVYKERHETLENWGKYYIKGSLYSEKVSGSDLAHMPGTWYVTMNEGNRSLGMVWFKLENTTRP